LKNDLAGANREIVKINKGVGFNSANISGKKYTIIKATEE
jgi:hypothetical protein